MKCPYQKEGKRCSRKEKYTCLGCVLRLGDAFDWEMALEAGGEWGLEREQD